MRVGGVVLSYTMNIITRFQYELFENETNLKHIYVVGFLLEILEAIKFRFRVSAFGLVKKTKQWEQVG